MFLVYLFRIITFKLYTLIPNLYFPDSELYFLTSVSLFCCFVVIVLINILFYPTFLHLFIFVLLFIYSHSSFYSLTHSYSVINDATNSLPNRFARSAEVRDRDAVLLAVARRLQVEVQPRQDDARAVGRPDVQRAVLVVPVVQGV